MNFVTEFAKEFETECKSEFEEEGNENIQPNEIIYNSVMDAYAWQGDVEGANNIFKMMKEHYCNGNKNANPNVVETTSRKSKRARRVHE